MGRIGRGVVRNSIYLRNFPSTPFSHSPASFYRPMIVVDQIKKGQQVWVLDGAAYVRGAVLEVTEEISTVAFEDGRTVTCAQEAVFPSNPSLLDGVDDLTRLSHLHEAGILCVLRDRFGGGLEGMSRKEIYTHAGPVLIAVNPFQSLPDLYAPGQVNHFVRRPAMGVGANDVERYRPHIFLTADKAFKEMRLRGKSQSIIITGESGAGKTETTKFVMQYVAGLVGGGGLGSLSPNGLNVPNGSKQKPNDVCQTTSMETRVLETNPILEAFGNAKTLHNNNSSRFGKLIDIHFEQLGGASGADDGEDVLDMADATGQLGVRMCGARIETYLLEKSRVVHQLTGERNYHVFYQLIRGADAGIKQACLIDGMDVGDFAYLNKSGCDAIGGVDDAEEFGRVCGAMSDIGITAEQQLGFWKTLACILFLGNVEFDRVSDDAVAVRGSPALDNAAALMGVGVEAMEKALSKKTMTVGGDVITMEMNMETAQDVRDALAKFLYEAQFRDLVGKVNDGICESHIRGANGQGLSPSKVLSLSLLDIYGFECFQTNSFEQLCINYANERLQQQFAAHLFKLEQAMYEEEGVDWTYVEFEDNQACVDLIEAKPPAGLGILTLLDEECLFPKGTDATFSEKVCKTHSAHERFAFNANKPDEAFTVHHYAGPVTYSAGHFLDKNRDTLNPDLVSLVRSSDSPYLVSLSEHMGGTTKSLGPGAKKMASSVGSRFREQLKVLLDRLDASQLHFVRCIKPNASQQPSRFDDALVLHQLKCCGILEVARIARAGYPTRYGHKEFAERYKLFLPEDHGSPLENSVAILKLFGVDEDAYQVGKTKLFFRAGVLGHLEDHVVSVTEACLRIQTVYRMHRCRDPFLRKRESALRIQSAYRMRQARIEYKELRRVKTAAACRVQSSFRGWREREEFLRVFSASVALQRWWRQELLRKKILERVAMEKEREEQERLAHAALAAAAVVPVLVGNTEVAPSDDLLGGHNPFCDEFSMTEDEIRNILRMAAAGQLVEAGPTDTAANPRPTSPDSALQQLQKINVELQKQIEDLKDENALLVDEQARQLSLSAKKQMTKSRVVAISADAGSPRSASSVSIMSYSDLQETENNESERVSNAGVRREMSFGRAGPEGAVAGLSAELSKKGPIFADDAAFIREVHEGVSLAPNMDPDFEIKRLIVRYKTWSRDFKARLKATQSSLKASKGACPSLLEQSSSQALTSPSTRPSTISLPLTCSAHTRSPGTTSMPRAYVSASARPIGDPVNHSAKKGIFKKLLKS